MGKSGWIGTLEEQRKLLLIVSVYTSLQQFLVHWDFLNHMRFLSIWQFSARSVFMNLFRLPQLLLVSKENISGEYVRISLDLRHQQNFGQIIKLFIGKMLHVSLSGCLERVNEIFYGMKSCCHAREKSREEKS